VDGAEEVTRESVVPCGDPAEVLEAPEHALDGVSPAVEEGREAAFPDPVGLGPMLGIAPAASIFRRMLLLS
jgi:hypothetical protein